MIAADSAQRTLATFARELDAATPFALATRSPDLGGASEQDLVAARRAWNARVGSEYRSIHVFVELLACLTKMSASYDALACVHRLIGDEIRHAKACLTVAAWFGIAPDIDAEIGYDLGKLSLVPSTDPIASRALEIVCREVVVVESESVAAMAALRASSTDSAILEVFDTFLAEEGRHHVAGLALEAWILASYDPGELEPFFSRREETMRSDRARLRGDLREGAVGGPGSRYGAAIVAAACPPPLS